MANRYYELALKVATTSQHEKQQMGAVLVRGGCILSIAPNMPSMRWGKHIFSKHAEIRAIQSGHDYSGATLYVARINSKMSKPCDKCMVEIKAAKIKKIVYANWDGDLEEIRVDD